MKRKNFLIIGILSSLLLLGCASNEKEKVTACAIEFAHDFFNLHFDKAVQNCTSESRKWIEFYASNLTEEDMEVIRNFPEAPYVMTADCLQINDSTATVRCIICNTPATDSLEQRKGHIIPERNILIPMWKNGSRWTVRMEGPLQNAR